jgi:hypothetical protein
MSGDNPYVPTNWELGSLRASNVLRMLVSKSGLNPTYLTAVSYGEFRPIATNETVQGRGRNRRVEIRILRNYILPSIRILDAKRYTENPYYKNIKLPDVKLGTWEFKNEAYAPYRAVICDDMMLNSDFSEIPPLGFFTERFEFPAVLEDGNEWMTLTPVDLDTSDYAIERARGKVVTFGLGLGYFAYMASEKEDVESVTVVELSSDVIRLFREKILPKFSHPEKINIVNADAFEYAEKTMPNENFDFAFVDTWRDASDGAPMYKKMKALEHLSRGTEFSYWIENFIISRLRAEKFEELYALVKQDSENAPKSYCEFIERLKQYG